MKGLLWWERFRDLNVSKRRAEPQTAVIRNGIFFVYTLYSTLDRIAIA